MRLGTYHRALILKNLNLVANRRDVLDVGCYNGYFLSLGEAKNKIGVDLNPIRKYENVNYIKGDICQLNFKNKKFDKIFALDVIEHVEDDKAFIKSLIKLLDKNGQLVLTTPHKDIKIFPPFLTNFVDKRMWKHKRSGYLKEELISVFPKNFKIKIIEQREFFFRFFFLPLRLIWLISERLGQFILKIIIKLDGLIFQGSGGHIFLIATKWK